MLENAKSIEPAVALLAAAAGPKVSGSKSAEASNLLNT